MGGLYLGYYNTSTHAFGHVLECMPDKFIEMPIIRDAILKYNAQDAFSMLQSKKACKYPVLCLSHFNQGLNVIFMILNVHYARTVIGLK